MGLLYQFPTTDNELDDRITISNEMVVLKSYGLPMIFWGYLAGILFMLAIMYLAISGPIQTIFSGEDEINKMIAMAVVLLFIAIPLTLFVLLFYEKIIIKEKNKFTIVHKVFWLPYFKRSFIAEKILVENMEGTPNVAKMENRPELKGFQNRGYFNLFAYDQNNRKFLLDRSSQKNTIDKIAELLKI
jgi:hypothetical protein